MANKYSIVISNFTLVFMYILLFPAGLLILACVRPFPTLLDSFPTAHSLRAARRAPLATPLTMRLTTHSPLTTHHSPLAMPLTTPLPPGWGW
jgi:hypothetical protein